MNAKKITLLTIILMIAISSAGMVSAGWFDFLGFGDDNPLLNSSYYTINFHDPVESSEYAFYYEDTGEYASSANLVSFDINSTLNFDVGKLYKHCEEKDMDETQFKESLKKMCDNGNFTIGYKDCYNKDNVSFSTHLSRAGGGFNNTHATLSEDGTVLTITSHNKFERYLTGGQAQEITNIKNIDHITFDFMGEKTNGARLFWLQGCGPLPVQIK